MIAFFLVLVALAAGAGPHPGDEGDPVDSLAFVKGGMLVGGGCWIDEKTGRRVGVLRPYDAKTGRIVRRFAGHEDGAVAVAASPDGTRRASSDQARRTEPSTTEPAKKKPPSAAGSAAARG